MEESIGTRARRILNEGHAKVLSWHHLHGPKPPTSPDGPPAPPPPPLSWDRVGQEAARTLERYQSRDLWRAVGFVALNFFLGLLWFITMVPFVTVGFVSLIVLIGVPILAGLMAIWTRGAKRQRRRIESVSGIAIPEPYRPETEGFFVRRLWAKAHDSAVWRDLLYLIALFPVGLLELAIVFLVGSLAIQSSLIIFIFWMNSGASWIGPFHIDSFGEAVFFTLVGFVMIRYWPSLVFGIRNMHVSFAQTLLGPSTGELTERVEELTKTRSGAMEAMLVERRRIERDLHDGAQQRLVALAMDLGMAKEKMKTDPDAAQKLVESSHEEAKRVLSELRDLVRGIYPAVLTDRGLDAAISSVAGRSPVQVTVDVQLEGRSPEAVEATAYFVVAEALTNVAKHSGATEALVWVRRVKNHLYIEVSDNGEGGADASEGTGLGGLRDRVAALDGTFTVISPPGGPTRIRAEIPIGP
jgi:signal transduction histidine kinase